MHGHACTWLGFKRTYGVSVVHTSTYSSAHVCWPASMCAMSQASDPCSVVLVQMLRSEDPGVHYEAVGVLGNLVHSSQDIKQQVLQVRHGVLWQAGVALGCMQLVQSYMCGKACCRMPQQLTPVCAKW